MLNRIRFESLPCRVGENVIDDGRIMRGVFIRLGLVNGRRLLQQPGNMRIALGRKLKLGTNCRW